jgi:cell division protein FtsB
LYTVVTQVDKLNVAKTTLEKQQGKLREQNNSLTDLIKKNQDHVPLRGVTPSPR